MEIRKPAVAGRFYDADPDKLKKTILKYLDCGPAKSEGELIGILAPHAGYLYSGAIAGAAYAEVVVPRSAIVLCPNHTGMGARRSLWASGSWRLPGGELKIDQELAERVREAARLDCDSLAHQHEHALEVQLPFLRARNPQVAIVPICLSALSARDCVALGEGIARAIGEHRQEVLLVASTDLSHYISAAEARHLDGLALERVQALDPEGLYRTVRSERISMCGVLPATVVLFAARRLGATSARLIRYATSGDVSRDFDQVVGYAGLAFR